MSETIHNNADAQLTAVQMLWQENRVAEAEARARELVRRFPRRDDVAMLLAEILRSQGKLDAACDVVFALCRASCFDTQTSLRGARFIQECQRQTIADDLCDAAIKRGHASLSMLALAGNIARERGDFEKARARYLAALNGGIDLNVWQVLGALAHTRRYTDPRDLDFERFTAHFADTKASASSRASTGFGLAKFYDDVDDRERAAAVLREANGLVRSVLPWSDAAWRDFVTARKVERVARLRNVSDASFIPVFIVGLPRSGTTLTAAQLSRSTDARDRGELRAMRFIAETLIGGGHTEDQAAIEEAAQLYVVQSRQDDAPATHYIDQDPLNFRYLNLIEAMFPQARVIVCRRNLRDTALSLWSQDFAHRDCAFAYDLADIAAYIDGYETLMHHWQETLSIPLHTVEYEALVTDPQSTLARLREFIGAPEVKRPNAAASITSASVWQARQPIYTTSVGRWRGYLPFIPELMQFPE